MKDFGADGYPSAPGRFYCEGKCSSKSGALLLRQRPPQRVIAYLKDATLAGVSTTFLVYPERSFFLWQ